MTMTENCPTPETHNSGCGCPSDVAAAVASCPGHEIEGPSPCRCRCLGCAYNCGDHDPTRRNPMTDQPTLRNRIRQILAEADGFSYDCLEPHDYQRHADAILALPGVLSAPVDRATVLREAADDLATAFDDPTAKHIGLLGAAHLRRMADEAQQPEEAWPSESRWQVEIYARNRVKWMVIGSFRTRDEAERRLALDAEREPRWLNDGTEIRRRIVHMAVTYTVEAEEAQR